MYQMQNQNMAFNQNPSYAAYQYNPMQRFQQPEPQIPQMQPQFLGIQGYHQMPEDYHRWEDMSDAERMRDLDRMSHGKMYYSEPMSGDQMSTGTHDAREGRAGMSRRSYIETKEMHHGDSAADKDAKMKELEKYMKSLSEDVTELFSGMSPEEKQLTKTKLTTLVTKM